MNKKFTCRSCGSSRVELVIDLGIQPLANNLLRKEDLGKLEPRFPLNVFVCQKCWLLQIAELVPPVELFSEYLYFSSFSNTMLAHAKLAVEQHCREQALNSQNFVVEIASNDGYLLQYFKEKNIPCLGIEPAKNVALVAQQKGIDTWSEFFGLAIAKRVCSKYRKADLIIANNVFAHAPDINDFVAGISNLLHEGGRCVIEFPYGIDLVEKTEFDTIYHEHVFYFTLTPLIPLFHRHGLEIFHVEKFKIHGGSLRIFASHVGKNIVRPSVTDALAIEQRKAVGNMSFYSMFSDQAVRIKNELLAKISEYKKEKKRIAAYGASAKGSTLLNYCELGQDSLEFVVDRSTYKHGRYTPGMRLPILPAEQLAESGPDFTLLLTWNFEDEILAQQKLYRDRGGRFLIPIPTLRVL